MREYARGISPWLLARRLVEEADPKKLEAAVQARRPDEPIVVGVLAGKRSPDVDLVSEMQSVMSEVRKLEH